MATSSASSSSAASLSASVTSLKSSLQLLDSSISILDAGISDFPRLSTVLTTTRHFELTPSTTLQTAQESLASELHPAITTLLNRADSYLAKLERREQALIARAELQEGRLAQSTEARKRSNSGSAAAASRRSLAASVGMDGGSTVSQERELRLKALRQKKERLGYAVERLGLQSQQRQRQLRMSVSHAAT